LVVVAWPFALGVRQEKPMCWRGLEPSLCKNVLAVSGRTPFPRKARVRRRLSFVPTFLNFYESRLILKILGVLNATPFKVFE
jgi:hypothetical protein